MKIGLLTLPLHSNYGGIIQAVALYNYLEQLGHEVKLIKRDRYNSLAKRVAYKLLRATPFQDIKGVRSSQKQKNLHKAFIAQHFRKQTARCFTKSDLEKVARNEQFDAIVVGSDQVWRMDYINDGHYASYFLDFADSKTRKISYAASFGTDTFTHHSQTSEITALLANFSAVSTRESSGLKICREQFSRNDCTQVVDPTLLIDPLFYKQFIRTPPPTPGEKYLLRYTLDESSEKQSLSRIVRNSIPGITHEISIDTSGKTGRITVPDWIQAFHDADFVITDSFHGMVFSIIFEKNFYVTVNQERGASRFYSLLALLGLESRVISEKNLASLPGEVSTIDYSTVTVRLEQLRAQSREFLDSALNP